MNEPNKDDPRIDEFKPPSRERGTQEPDFYAKLTLELWRKARQAEMMPEEAEDVAQTVWLRFLVSWPEAARNEAPARWRGWLLRVASHEIANFFRHQSRHPVQSLDALSHEPADRRREEREDVCNEEQKQWLLRRWLAELRKRSPLTWRLLYGRSFEGCSIKKLAEETGLTPNQISCRISSQMRKFRRWARRLGIEESDSP